MTTQQTTTNKGYHGWKAETIVIKSGYQYQVYTIKQSDGKIRSTAQKIEESASGIITFSLFSNDKDHRITLLERKAIATEQNIKSCHAEALAIFEAYQLETIAPLEPGVNTIFWLDGYGHYKGEIGNEYICYEVKRDKWGTSYKCVEPTEGIFKIIDHPSHESKKFGIGHYYNDTYIFAGSQDDLSNIIIAAHNATKKREAEEAEAARLAKIAADAKAQELSQYTQADVRKTGALLKSYAKSLGIASVTVRYDSYSMGNSYDITYQASEKNETFENLCNSLNYSSYDAYSDYWDTKEIEPVILEGHILHTFKHIFVKFEQLEVSRLEHIFSDPVFLQMESGEVASDLIISDYSEKAIVIRGNTKPIKDQLKDLGGSFNFKLKGGPGWIFSKKRESEIRKTFNL